MVSYSNTRFPHTEVANYEGKIVILKWKKAKVIGSTYGQLIIVLQQDWKYKNTSGKKHPDDMDPYRSSHNTQDRKYNEKNHTTVSKDEVILLDARKNPERYKNSGL